MKISNSKKQLAKIISENGGWRDGARFAWFQGKLKGRPCHEVWFGEEGSEPEYVPNSGSFHCYWSMVVDKFPAAKFDNWHQTILSRDEYFHLYPAQDADGWIEWKGGECPVRMNMVDVKFRQGSANNQKAHTLDWSINGDNDTGDIIAYRLHKPEQSKSTAVGDDETNLAAKEELEALEFEPVPTIEQLAADYRAKLAIAQKAREEADSHRCGVEAALERLYQAGFAIGLDIAIAEETEAHEPDSEPNELKISHWSDLVVGDVISLDCPGYNLPVGEYEVVEIDYNNHDNYPQPIKVMWNGSLWRPDINARKWRFIRRP